MLSLQVGFISRFEFVRQVSTQIFSTVGFFKVKSIVEFYMNRMGKYVAILILTSLLTVNNDTVK